MLESRHALASRAEGGRRFVVLAACSAVFGLCLLGASASAEVSKERRLERSIDRLVDAEEGPPGVSVLLRRGKQRTFIRAGERDVESGRPFRRRDHMRVASVAKAFSGAAALALVDQGELSLDSTIAERLPGLPAEWGPVTLRQLLAHTSGLPNITADPGYINAFLAAPLAEPLPVDLIALMSDTALEFAPGSEYRYSNTDNMVIGLIVEAAVLGAPGSGLGYANALRATVLRPLGLRRTSLPRGNKLPLPFIHGYDRDPLEDLTECCAAAWSFAAGGVVSTPADLGDFVAGYAGGELFGGETRRAQFRFIKGGESQPPGPGKNSAGLALFRYRTPCGTVFGHTGNTFGYTQLIAGTRSGRRSLNVATNEQLNPETRPGVFAKLDRVYERAVCALLD